MNGTSSQTSASCSDNAGSAHTIRAPFSADQFHKSMANAVFSATYSPPKDGSFIDDLYRITEENSRALNNLLNRWRDMNLLDKKLLEGGE